MNVSKQFTFPAIIAIHVNDALKDSIIIAYILITASEGRTTITFSGCWYASHSSVCSSSAKAFGYSPTLQTAKILIVKFTHVGQFSPPSSSQRC